MNNTPFEIKLKVVEHYLESDDSIRSTADRFGVSYRAAFRWVQWYREEGEGRLCQMYRRPWNRVSADVERAVVGLKEADPSLTLRKARAMLMPKHIALSVKAIWGIWKRYGYAGFDKKELTAQFTDFGSSSIEAEKKLMQAKQLHERNNVKASAQVLNSIPFLRKNDLVLRIPTILLNDQRRLEKLSILYGKAPLPEYLRETKKLHKRFLGKKNHFAALRAGIMNIIASSWSLRPEEELKKISACKALLGDGNGYCSSLLYIPRFLILIAEGIAYASLLQIKKARKVAHTCRQILRHKRQPSPYFMSYLHTLFTHLDEFKKAGQMLAMSMRQADTTRKRQLTIDLIKQCVRSGAYREASQLLRRSGFKEEFGGESGLLRSEAIISLMRGAPHKAIEKAMKSLTLSKKQELNLYFYHANYLVACAYCSLGDRKKAKQILRRLIPFLEKSKLKKDLFFIKIFLTGRTHAEKKMLRNENILPRIKLPLMLKMGNYWNAYHFADSKGMLSFFHRYVLFYPETVLSELEKGRIKGLPKAMLRLPVFNERIHLFDVRFLGAIIVRKDQEKLAVSLPPKDASFLIFLALKKGKSILLDRIYRNFWPRSSNPARNLSHLLVRIRKVLALPRHLLYIREGRLFFDCFFTTDYNEYVEYITRGKALRRTGEWELAMKEYLLAFALFRGEPFRQMYDDWSDDKRLEVLFKFENDLVGLAKDLIGRNQSNVAAKLLRRALPILQYSDEIDALLSAIGAK